MANVVAGTDFGLNFAEFDIARINQLFPTQRQPNFYAGDLRRVGSQEYRYEFFGNGFRYDANGVPQSGTVTAYQETQFGQLVWRLDGASVPVTQVRAWIVNGQTEAALSSLLRGDDVFVGSAVSDYIIGFTGRDLIDLGAGEDLGFGGSGNDTIIGGPGFDAMQLSGFQAEYSIVVWGETIAAVPNSPAVLAIDGIDKGVGVEFLYSFAEDDLSAVGPSNFSPLEYIASHGDLARAFGANATAGFDHYIYNGIFERRATTFDALEYLASYRDLRAAFGANEDQASTHYIVSGRAEGRAVTFDGLQYIATHPDLILAFGANRDAGSLHYITNGAAERRATDQFDAAQYLANYGDLRAAFGADQDAAAAHYISNGYYEGRTDDPLIGRPFAVDTAAAPDFLL